MYLRKIFMKFLFCIPLLVFGLSGCLKDSADDACTDQTPQSENAAMQAYAAANGYTMTAHTSGLLYEIVSQGTGPAPLSTSKVFVRYTGKFVSNNIVFDQQTDHNLTGWQSSTLIPGWQLGIPLIQEGGTIRLIIPSALGYGCRGFSTIPPDAVLFFQIELVDVQ